MKQIAWFYIDYDNFEQYRKGSADSCVSGSQRLQRKVIDKAVYSCGRKRQERNVALLSLYH